jgi:K+-sensing histidine kinase KdpD
METIEIPRFLLDYFDSSTIRTPLTCIQGYTDVMLKEIAGPLTDDQKHYLEIIRQSAEELNKHFSLVMNNQHYIAWDQQAFPGQFNVNEITSDFEEIIQHFPPMTVAVQVSDDSLPLWVDRRHLYNAFRSIAEFAVQTYDEKKSHEITLQIYDKAGFVTFLIDINRKESLSKRDLSYFESFLYVAQRVSELHNGNFFLNSGIPEKLSITLVFPNVPRLNVK